MRWVSLLLLGAPLFAGEIDNLLRIGAIDKALILAEPQKNSPDKEIKKEVITAFCMAGRPMDVLSLIENDDQLEEVSWAFISKGSNSAQLFHRWIALQLAADLHSYRSVAFIQKALHDSNIALRGAACPLAASMHDKVLIQGLKKLIVADSDSAVRLAALQALSQTTAKEMASYMVQLMYEEESLSQEKIAAVAALATLKDKVDREEIVFLVSSNRAIMRLFAIQLVLASGQKESFHDLLPLIKDTHHQVKMALLEAAVVLGVCEKEKFSPLLNDRDFRVKITASWALGSKENLAQFLRSKNQPERCLAASACGKLGFSDLLERQLEIEKDLFVRLNIAEGLLKDDRTAAKACDVIFSVLTSYSGPLMSSQDLSPGLPLLLPSQLKREALSMESDIDIHDLLVRMELLKQLICKKSAQALVAMKSFLKEKRLGKATLASFVLLQEGDEETALNIEKLLSDEDEELRFQAAVLLGGLFSDPKALVVLKEHYETTDLETRLKILEALGRIGDKESLPFLKKQQTDPSLLVQMLASWAIIAILNH